MPDFTKIDAARLEQASTQGPNSLPPAPDQNSIEKFQRALDPEGTQQHQSRQFFGKPELSPANEQASRLTPAPADRPGVQPGTPPESPDPERPLGAMQDAGHQPEHSRQKKDPGGEPRIFQDPDETTTEEFNPRSLPTPMDSLFSQRMTFMPTTPTPPDLPRAPENLSAKLVEQILVGRSAGGEHEVRLQIGSDILPGTEIRIQRGADGLIHVRLISDNAASFQTLVAAQDSLKQRLEQSGEQVRVSVSSEAGAEDNDSQRRSRGYIPPTDENR